MEVISNFIGKSDIKFEICRSNGGVYLTFKNEVDKVTVAMNTVDFLAFSHHLFNKKEEELKKRVKLIIETGVENGVGFLPGTVEEKVFNCRQGDSITVKL